MLTKHFYFNRIQKSYLNIACKKFRMLFLSVVKYKEKITVFKEETEVFYSRPNFFKLPPFDKLNFFSYFQSKHQKHEMVPVFALICCWVNLLVCLYVIVSIILEQIVIKNRINFKVLNFQYKLKISVLKFKIWFYNFRGLHRKYFV